MRLELIRKKMRASNRHKYVCRITLGHSRDFKESCREKESHDLPLTRVKASRTVTRQLSEVTRQLSLITKQFSTKSHQKRSFRHELNCVIQRLFSFLVFHIKMTFKSLINFGNFEKAYTPIERYHSEGSGHHGRHGNSKGKGGSGAALSALTLLAFLFLINIMQQSLQDNNSTAIPTTTVLLRDTELPIVLDNRENEEVKAKDDLSHEEGMYNVVKTVTSDYFQHEN